MRLPEDKENKKKPQFLEPAAFLPKMGFITFSSRVKPVLLHYSCRGSLRNSFQRTTEKPRRTHQWQCTPCQPAAPPAGSHTGTPPSLPPSRQRLKLTTDSGGPHIHLRDRLGRRCRLTFVPMHTQLTCTSLGEPERKFWQKTRGEESRKCGFIGRKFEIERTHIIENRTQFCLGKSCSSIQILK